MNSIVEVVKFHALHSGAHVVYTNVDDSGKETRITYSDLNAKSHLLANKLLQHIPQGERAVILVPQGVDYIYVFYACLYAGVVAVPFYPPTTNNHKEKVVKVVNNSDARLVITIDALKPRIDEYLEEEEQVKIITIRDLEGGGDLVKLPLPQPDSLAFLQYTSGSTGNPKGVMISHSNILSNLTGLEEAAKVNKKDVFCSWLPLFHDLGLITGFLLPAYLGAHGVLMAPARFIKRPLVWFETISQYKVTVSGAPNFAYALCHSRIKEDGLKNIDLSSWRIAYNAAEPIESKVLNNFMERFSSVGFKANAFFTSYGMAEATAFLTSSSADKPVVIENFNKARLQNYHAQPHDCQKESISVVGCGKVDDKHQLKIVSLDTKMELTDGQIGEVWCSGPSISRGYWGDEEKTKSTFNCQLADKPGTRYLSTGDLGFIYQGELYISGRIKDILIINGRNYTPHDLEACSGAAYEGLRAGGTVAFQMGNELVLVQEIERKLVKTFDYEQALLAISSAIFELFGLVVFKVCFIKAARLPRTSSGKLRRSLTAQMFENNEFEQLNEHTEHSESHDLTSILPVTATEKKLALIWQDLFALDQVVVNDNFISLGGDSITATQLISEVVQTFSISLNIRDLFEQPTLARMAALIDNLAGTADFPLVIKTQEHCGTMTSGQNQLWMLDQIYNGSSNYNLSMTIAFAGSLDIKVFNQTINALIARHTPLRTTFSHRNSSVESVIGENWQFELEQFDAVGANFESPLVQEIIDSHSIKPFNLASDLMIRGAIINLGPQSTLVNLTIHHIASDGWSKNILQQEINSIYNAFIKGEEHNLPPLPINYENFAVWQQEWLTSAEASSQLDYWKLQLESAPELHKLPLDKPRPKIQTFNGGIVRQDIPSTLSSALKQLAKKEQVTLFMVLNAAFASFMNRYSGENDIVIGSSSANRGITETMPLVGFFTNPLLLRSRFSSDITFKELVGQSKANVLNAFENQELPFEVLVNELSSAGSTNFNPLFQVMLTLQNNETTELNLSGLEATELEPINYPALFDLTLDVYETPQGIQINWQYATDIFVQSTVSRMAGHFIQLLTNLVKTPDLAISNISILNDSELAKLIEHSEQSANISTQDKLELCFHQLFEQHAVNSPDSRAVSMADESLTYKELNEKANQLAHTILSYDIGVNANIVLKAERSINMLVGVLAVFKAGACYIPVDADVPENRLDFIIKDTNAALLLTCGDSSLIPEIIEIDTINLDVDGVKIVEFSKENPSCSTVSIKKSDPAYIIYTSGSTGLPKGVIIEHGNLLNYLQHSIVSYMSGLSSGVVSTNLSFDATVTSLFTPLVSGAEVILVPAGSRELEHLANIIKSAQVPMLFKMTPAHLIVLGDILDNFTSNVAHCLVIGGEQLTWAVLDLWRTKILPDGIYFNEYGPTEATVGCSVSKLTQNSQNTDNELVVSIGSPIGNTRLYVMNSSLQLMPTGVIGELYIGGDSVSRGYLKDKHADKFISDPFNSSSDSKLYRTGDLVKWRNDGQLEFIERVDEQVKLHGYRIELSEIENVLLKDTRIKSVKVVVNRDKTKLLAYVVATTPDNITEELRVLLKGHLPNYMIPSAFIYLTELPLTANGKVDVKALPQEKVPESKVVDSPERTPVVLDDLQKIWCEILSVEHVGVDSPFFDSGGNSMLAIEMRHKIFERLGVDISVTDIFSYPTIRGLSQFMSGTTESDSSEIKIKRSVRNDEDIAVIGMALRFPDASTPQDYWDNLCAGKESINYFTDEELLNAGIPAEQFNEANYIKTGVLLEGIEDFDAEYFGFTPREVEIMDPQQRLLFECSDEALQLAGYGSRSKDNNIGVFVGVGENRYITDNLLTQSKLWESYDRMAVMLGNSSDFAATRISHKLNLDGPSINVGTACSTSLVAINQACSSLLDGTSDMALAGGASLHILKPEGVNVVDGGIASLDGHCRPFDSQASGARAGDGAAVVVLKRLSDALSDGDEIHAVIKGSAINNDGADKVGFTAPSVDGQVKVIKRALSNAGVEPDSIGYIETHGTGTKLGDPVEIAALKRVFSSQDSTNSCALGAVKANIGHLASASGIAGFIKSVFVVKHGVLPPNIHFNELNPDIDFAKTGFYLNSVKEDWQAGFTPRRAGVSSFGIGGTNAHVVLEQPPERTKQLVSTSQQIIVLSAKSDKALQASREALGEEINRNPQQSLADIAFTLQTGREAHNYRYGVSCDSLDGLSKHLSHTLPSVKVVANRSVVFLFTGQGSQYAGMAHDLYQQGGIFRETFDYCAQYLQPLLAQDIRECLSLQAESEDMAQRISQTSLTQPLLFSLEYALSKFWLSLGVKPTVMIGHSLGEYVAATLAGVFSLDDALSLIVVRGKLMQSAAPGAMISVALPASELKERIAGAGCSLAAINGPQACVISGDEAAIALLEQELLSQEAVVKRLATSHAYHSASMDPILPAFYEEVKKRTRNKPKMAFMSNVTGELISDEQAIDPQYWVNHLRGTVNFSQGIENVSGKSPLFLEIGPGRVLADMVKRHDGVEATDVLNSIRHPKVQSDDVGILYNTVTKLWQAGVEIDWSGLRDWSGLPDKTRVQRVALPPHPYMRQRYWIEAGTSDNQAVKVVKKSSNRIENMCYTPVWQRKLFDKQIKTGQESELWLVFADQSDFHQQLSQQLEALNHRVILVEQGSQYCQKSESHFVVNPINSEDYLHLFRDLALSKAEACKMLHLGSINTQENKTSTALSPEYNFNTLFALSKAIVSGDIPAQVELNLVTLDSCNVTTYEPLDAMDSTLISLGRVLQQECSAVKFCHIDVSAADIFSERARSCQLVVKELVNDLMSESREITLAIRGRSVWSLDYQPYQLNGHAESMIKQNGVYIITGGLGNIGLTLAKLLAEKYQAKIVLVGRKGLPPRDSWSTIQSDPSATNATKDKIAAVLAMENAGSEVLVVGADVSIYQQLEQVFLETEKKFGKINGIIHGAGSVEHSAQALQTTPWQHCEEQFSPKIIGTQVLDELLQTRDFDFCLLMSSLSSVLGGLGFGAYAAANSFMDTFVQKKYSSGDDRWLTINWDGWQFNKSSTTDIVNNKFALKPEQCVQIFEYLMSASDVPQVIVSSGDLDSRIAEWLLHKEAEPIQTLTLYPRPDISTPFEKPRFKIEFELVKIWEELLGIGGIGINDNFFELDGDSLLLTRVVTNINKHWNINLSLQKIFEQPVVTEMALEITKLLTISEVDKIVMQANEYEEEVL